MHANIPDNDAAPGPDGRDNPCPAGTGRSSAVPGNTTTLQGGEQHLPDEKLRFRLVRNILRNTGLPADSLQTITETCRKVLSRTLRNVPAPGSAVRAHLPKRSFRFFSCPHIRQHDAFRDKLIIPITDPGLWMDEPECRPGQDELRTGNARPVQEFWRVDWTERSFNRGNSR